LNSLILLFYLKNDTVYRKRVIDEKTEKTYKKHSICKKVNFNDF